MKKVALTFGILILLILPSCFPVREGAVAGSGVKKLIAPQLHSFSSIEVRGQGTVIISQQPAQISIQADDNIIPFITATVEGETLVISQPKDTQLKPVTPIVYRISTPQIEKIDASGFFKVESSQIEGDRLQLTVAGSTDTLLNVAVQELIIKASGSTSITIKGSARTAMMAGAGQVKIKAFGLACEKVDINGSGSTIFEVAPSKEIAGMIAGSGRVLYHGAPTISLKQFGTVEVRKVG